MLKSARDLAQRALSASSRRIAGSILPISPQRTGRQLTAHSLAQPSSSRSLHQNKPLSTLEIERKFAPTTTSMQQLARNTGTPPFESLVFHGTTSLADIYYDTADDLLFNAGVWLRRRGDKWEAKIRIGGDFTNSAFEEITDVEDISSMLGRLVPGTALDPRDGLTGGWMREMARFVSKRIKFFVDGKFTVVLDETDFGHVVGEVELEREVPITRGDDQERAQVAAEMDREIADFMRRYVWAFPPGKPVGKLSAYFALKQRQ